MDRNLKQINENKKRLLRELVEYRKGEGLTIDKISNMTGWKPEVVEKFEEGAFDGDTMERNIVEYALAIGVTIDYSFTPFQK